MSYEKHTWETGETITAEKLNNLEDGVASGGVGIFVVNDINGTLDATWNQIYQEIIANNKIIFVVVYSGSFDDGYYSYEKCIVDRVSFNDPYYSISVGAGTYQYNCENKDGYPSTN